MSTNSVAMDARVDVGRVSQLQAILFHLAVFAVALLLLFSRRPDALLNAQFFAEDGTYWFAEAYQFGWQSLLIPKAGYLSTVSHLIAMLSLLFPIAVAPLVMNLCALVVQILPVNLFLSTRFRTIPLGTRLLAGLIYLALPNCAEIHANATNVQWHLALLAFLVVAVPAEETWSRLLLDFPVLLLTPLNGPFGLLLLPIAGLFWWKRKDQESVLGIAALVPGSVLQGLMIVTSHARKVGTNGASLHRLLSILGRQIFLGSVLGSKTLTQLTQHMKLLSVVEIVVACIGLALVIYAFRFAPLELKLLLLFSAVLFAACLARPLPTQPGDQWAVMKGVGNFNRYFFFPMLAFLAAVLWMERSAKPRALRFAALAILLLTPIGAARDWRYKPFEDFEYQEFAASFEKAAPGTQFTVFINPNWEMHLTKK